MIILEILFVIFTPEVQIIHENAINFFSSKMAFLLKLHQLQVFTRLSLPSIHQPPWTTNLRILMHLKSIYTLFSQFLWTKNNISFTFSPYSSKKSKILILKILWFIEPLKLMILGGSLLFEIMGDWRGLLCAKQVISLAETMKLVFFPDRFVQTTSG